MTAETRAFYVDVLGCAPGRVRDRRADVSFCRMMLVNPSGNAIELKTYVDPTAALETPAEVWRPDGSR